MAHISARILVMVSLLFVTLNSNAAEQGAYAQILQSKNLSDLVAPLIVARAQRALEERKKEKAPTRHCFASRPWHAQPDNCGSDDMPSWYLQRPEHGFSSRPWLVQGN